MFFWVGGASFSSPNNVYFSSLSFTWFFGGRRSASRCAEFVRLLGPYYKQTSLGHDWSPCFSPGSLFGVCRICFLEKWEIFCQFLISLRYWWKIKNWYVQDDPSRKIVGGPWEKELAFSMHVEGKIIHLCPNVNLSLNFTGKTHPFPVTTYKNFYEAEPTSRRINAMNHLNASLDQQNTSNISRKKSRVQ